jgi:hypothetical protein
MVFSQRLKFLDSMTVTKLGMQTSMYCTTDRHQGLINDTFMESRPYVTSEAELPSGQCKN